MADADGRGFSATVRDGGTGRQLTAWVRRAGTDVIAVIGGGERPHVGSVVVAQAYPSKRQPGTWSASTSVLTIPPHKEEPMARPIAERLARETGAVAVVTAGVHDDNLDRQGIEIYLRLISELQDELSRRILEHWGPPPTAPPRAE